MSAWWRKMNGPPSKPPGLSKSPGRNPGRRFPCKKICTHYMRSAPPKASKETLKRGDAATAISSGAKKIDASYEFPFQSHATMGPGCAVADVHTDGITTVWSGGQKPNDLQKGFAEMLRVPSIRCAWFGWKTPARTGARALKTPLPMPCCFRKPSENLCACNGCAKT